MNRTHRDQIIGSFLETANCRVVHDPVGQIKLRGA